MPFQSTLFKALVADRHMILESSNPLLRRDKTWSWRRNFTRVLTYVCDRTNATPYNISAPNNIQKNTHTHCPSIRIRHPKMAPIWREVWHWDRPIDILTPVILVASSDTSLATHCTLMAKSSRVRSSLCAANVTAFRGNLRVSRIQNLKIKAEIPIEVRNSLHISQ